MEQWYTLYTKPNSEHQVATSLQTRGIQTYLPELESSEADPERRKPFFPCYLFVKIDLEMVGLSQVQWTPGLRYVVAFDEQPVPLPDQVIDLIRRRLEAMNASKSWKGHRFQPGETVRVADGPLQGLLAIFEGPTTPSQRVQVLLNFLGQVSRAHVTATDLEKITPEVEGPALKRPRRTRGRGRPIRGD